MKKFVDRVAEFLEKRLKDYSPVSPGDVEAHAFSGGYNARIVVAPGSRDGEWVPKLVVHGPYRYEAEVRGKPFRLSADQFYGILEDHLIDAIEEALASAEDEWLDYIVQSAQASVAANSRSCRYDEDDDVLVCDINGKKVRFEFG